MSSEGRSSHPIALYNNSELAVEEFKRRCGEEALRGLTVKSNEIYGSLRGYFISERPLEPIKVRKKGYKVVKRSTEEAANWKSTISKGKKTLKLTNT